MDPMTIDERLEALTMNLELTARRIEDFGQRTEQAAVLAQMELRDLRDSVNTLAASTAQLLKVAEHTDVKLNENRAQADAEMRDLRDRTTQLLRAAEHSRLERSEYRTQTDAEMKDLRERTSRLLKIAETHDRRIDLLERKSA
jgi:proline dehydrogenase